MQLFNPRRPAVESLDPVTREVVEKTVAYFEGRGREALRADYHARRWYDDFLSFIKRERIFAKVLTPAGYGGQQSAWVSRRLAALGEVLGFYGLEYWYVWQVSMLGLGPIWMSKNEPLKQRAAALLQDGAIFAFGLSEKDHGADIYSTRMTLTKQADGTYLARGRKYYIGNGNKAAIVSTFGKLAGSGEYVFFAVSSQQPNYECVKNVVVSQSYVAELALHDYPVREEDIIAVGPGAWDAALNTVNIGKYNLGWGSIGICTHALYEAVHHAHNRHLYKMRVTDFPHVKKLFMDAWVRLVAMRTFAARAADYMRSASPEDRRYLLYNPMVKMKVTTQGEAVINCLWDVIAAKGFEKDMYFQEAGISIRALPKLEGTVHVNLALLVKFMPNYFFNPREYPEVPERLGADHDAFLFNQGATKGLGGIQFHDFNPAYASFEHVPNVAIFRKQITAFQTLLMQATPSEEQRRDTDFLLSLGEIFALVVYGQLILEAAKMKRMPDAVVAQMFDFMIRDASLLATELLGKPGCNEAQATLARDMIQRPIADAERFGKLWEEHVVPLASAYA